MSKKPAPTEHPVHELIQGRWSPRSISDKPVEREKLLSVLEAARWAPSSFNEQPWRYVVCTPGNAGALEAARAVLTDGNDWARKAPVLICAVAKTEFTRNGKPNAHAWHDVGASSENMFLEAFNQGLVMHQMAGFHRDKAREVFKIPEGFEPVAMAALGYIDVANDGERTRKPLGEIAFDGAFGEPLE